MSILILLTRDLNILEFVIWLGKPRSVVMEITRAYAISDLPCASVSKRVFVQKLS